jgi:hypothetical protein
MSGESRSRNVALLLKRYRPKFDAGHEVAAMQERKCIASVEIAVLKAQYQSQCKSNRRVDSDLTVPDFAIYEAKANIMMVQVSEDERSTEAISN